MKKFFGRDKPKMARVTPMTRELAVASNPSEEPQPPYYPRRTSSIRRTASQSHEGRRSSSEEHWEVISPGVEPSISPYPNMQMASHTSSLASLPPGASLPTHSPAPRSSSPFSIVSNPHSHSHGIRTPAEREPTISTLKKKQPGSALPALSVLRALDPQLATSQRRSRSEEHLALSDSPFREDKKEKRNFWDRSSTRDKERENKERDKRFEDSPEELTRMIGYLTATASEDWALVLEVCDIASSHESYAKEAVRALRREFKYGEPPAQLSAARLWAIMLRNSSETFVSQSRSKKFLDTIEDILTSPRTSPVVRERLIDIVGAAAYASGSKIQDYRGDRDGFRGLWRKVKPVDKPDAGMPFDTDDAMFTPPAFLRAHRSSDDILPLRQEQLSSSADRSDASAPRKQKTTFSRDRIIPLEVDIRRLFQECKIGQGNASLLSESLAFVKPEDLTKKDIIREFYLECWSSQELIFAQIPWASAGAERSRLNRSQLGEAAEQTTQERLLAELLAANEALLEALRVYDDLERVAVERRVQGKSRKDRKHGIEGHAHSHSPSAEVGDGSSRPPSPSNSSVQSDSTSSATRPTPHLPIAAPPPLAPPPPAPHGPRLPQVSLSSRTPSPVTSNRHSRSSSLSSSENDHPPNVGRDVNYEQPSAKALGKRKVDADQVDGPFEGEEIFHGPRDEPHDSTDRRYFDAERSSEPWRHHVQYVYDAAAERTQQRIRDAHGLVNGVH